MNPHPYAHVRVGALPLCADGSLILTTGRYHRTLTGATLTDREHQLELIGEPFDWFPPHDSPLDVWGQLWSRTPPRLLIHNARMLGDTARFPLPSALRRAGATLRLFARITALSGQAVAVTADHHSYLLQHWSGPDGYYRLTGTVVSLNPPQLDVLVSQASAPPIPVPEG
jgi:hypothetical protein